MNTFKIVLNKLSKLDFNYLLIGGLLCKSVLLNHSRETNDIDILFDIDIKRIEELFKKEFEVIRFDSFSFSKYSTEESFTSIVRINGEDVLIEGRRIDYLNKIKKQTYKIDDYSFIGVQLEFQIAEKIIAMFSVPIPEYKHLIDLYSFSLLDESIYDKKKIKEYFDLLMFNKNKVKKMMNLPLLVPIKSIDSNKEFEGPMYLLTLQAGYNYSREYLISKVNEWLNSLSL